MVIGKIIEFGYYSWKVLAIENNKALIITNDILELRWYNDAFEEITWEKCTLRKYLNTEFYNKFSPKEKEQILVTMNVNHDNSWFKTPGGVDTKDYIFLLSLEEVCVHFGRSSLEKLIIKGKQKWLIDDENNSERQAKFNNEYHWWRLRSPGYYGRTSASVNGKGNIYVRGNGVYGRPKDGGGMRPALWLNLQDIN